MDIDITEFADTRNLVHQAEHIAELVVKKNISRLLTSTSEEAKIFCSEFNELCQAFIVELVRIFPKYHDLARLPSYELYVQIIEPLAHYYHKR